MKDKMGKRVEMEENGVIADFICSQRECADVTSPNLTFVCMQSCSVTQHNAHSLVKTQRVGHTQALW